MPRIRQPRDPEDIVIHIERPGAYVIVRMDGAWIGTSDNRRDAMRRACAAALGTGAKVWVHPHSASDTYNEVVCP